MPFGMTVAAPANFQPIVKYNASAGRFFRSDYDEATRTKTDVDITHPPPRFAIDFGSIQVGYVAFTATGPSFVTVPEGQKLPTQPADKDDKGKLIHRPGFKLTIQLSQALGGSVREWASSAGCVLEAVEDLYLKFRAAPEAVAGKIPVVELTKVVPIATGAGMAGSVFAPCFAIVGWTERGRLFGERTVPPPQATTAAAPPAASPQWDQELNDIVPF